MTDKPDQTRRDIFNVGIAALLSFLAVIASTAGLWSLALISIFITFLLTLLILRRRNASTFAFKSISVVFAALISSVLITNDVALTPLETIIIVILLLSLSSLLWINRIQITNSFVPAQHQSTEYDSEIDSIQQFRELADSVPILIWTASPNGTVNYISQQICRFCGLSVTPVLDNWLSVLHPDDRGSAVSEWDKALKDRTLYKTEYRIKRFDGAYIWHSVQGTPVFDKQGRIKQWYGSSVDIHNLKTLQKESEDLANKLSNTLESVTDAFITLDKNFKLTYVNQHAATLAGQNAAALLNQPIWNFCTLAEDGPFAIRFKQAMRLQQKIRFEEFLSTRKIWLDVHIYPSLSGLTIYFTDVTQQRAERQELLLLRTAVSRLNDIIIITEAEPIHEPGPRVVFVNEAFEKLTGYSKEEVLGKSPRILQGEHTQRDKLDTIGEALSKWQPVRSQLINYTKSGEEFWLDMDIVPIANEDGWYTHWVAVERDITEQKHTENKLLQSQKMESLGHITGGIAHDFNNLLTVILGNADLLIEYLPTDSTFLPLAEIISKAANRGSQLTQSLLSFSSKLSLDPTNVNINTLITNFKSVLETSLGEQHNLELELEQPLPDVMADEAYLESCLLNLVINARDAMSLPGSVKIQTHTKYINNENSPEEIKKFVVISVSDTGHGIETDIQPRIFEPFFSTKQPGYGTGLGLSMVFGFIHQIGGDIEVNSSPGCGSTFKLSLPVLSTKSTKVDRKLAPSEPVRKGCSILLVEDDAMVRDYAVKVLTEAGYSITQAASGKEAYEKLEAGQNFDIMFTDIVMPGGMNGLELAELTRKIAPNMPILFTSGYSEQTGKLNELIANENKLLRKPYRKTELLHRLKQLLAKSKTDENNE